MIKEPSLYETLSNWAQHVEPKLYSKFIPGLAGKLYDHGARRNGQGLCYPMTSIGCLAINNRFETPTYRVSGHYTDDSGREHPHTWMRAENQNEKVSVDLTYGQIGTKNKTLVIPTTAEKDNYLFLHKEKSTATLRDINDVIFDYIDFMKWSGFTNYMIKEKKIEEQLKDVYKHFLEA